VTQFLPAKGTSNKELLHEDDISTKTFHGKEGKAPNGDGFSIAKKGGFGTTHPGERKKKKS